MKRLIKRYVLKAQVDRENDEVNEGAWGPAAQVRGQHGSLRAETVVALGFCVLSGDSLLSSVSRCSPGGGETKVFIFTTAAAPPWGRCT